MQLSHQLIEDLINDLDDHKMVTQKCLTFPSVNNKVFNNIIKLLTWNGWIDLDYQLSVDRTEHL